MRILPILLASLLMFPATFAIEAPVAPPSLMHVLAQVAGEPSYAALTDLTGRPMQEEASLLTEALIDIAATRQALGNPADWTQVLAFATPSSASAPTTLTPPSSALNQVLAMYHRLGLQPTVAQTQQLKASLQRLLPSQDAGLAGLVQGVNVALDAQRSGDPGRIEGAVLWMAAAASQAPAQLGQGQALAPCVPLFEDPLYLIRIGSPCNDTVNATARILVYDPAGNDVYHHNAGGASPDGARTSGSTINAGITSETTPSEGLTNATSNPIFPLRPTNATWQEFVLGNSTAIVDGAGNATAWAVYAAETTRPFVTVNQQQLRQWVPVAFHIDLAGDDVYDSQMPVVQGAATAGGLGLLWDRAGHDRYTCYDRCQGFGEYGLGILFDEGGNDQYLLHQFGQGTGDGGVLIEWGGHDRYQATHYAQGGYTNTLIPSVYGGLLYDRAGNDEYQSGMLSQGANNLLVDAAGNDAYTATSVSQGFGVAESKGMLLDIAGHDRYTSTLGAAQGGAAGAARGILADLAGNDDYLAVNGQGVLASAGHSLGLLYDAQGDDVYQATNGQGIAMAAALVDGGLGILLDREGNDAYHALQQGQGSQRPSAVAGWTAGALVDLAGNDAYTAGAGSQGSSQGVGVGGLGLLLDRAGRDAFSAGDMSQGSGGMGGIGILLNGLPRRIQESVEARASGVTVSSDLEIQGPSLGTPDRDTFVAGDDSQGASGAGGVGLLIDGSEPAGAQVSRFTAGRNSQGAARGAGVGLLLNWEGRDVYEAGAMSQGSSRGGIAVLADFSDADQYAASEQAASTPLDGPSLGLLVDTHAMDTYAAVPNDACTQTGELGMVVDFNQADWQVDTWSVSCQSTLMAAVGQLISGQVDDALDTLDSLLNPPGYTPPSTWIYYEDFETGAPGWTTSGGDPLAAEWQLMDSATQVQPTPNAHSGTHYYYAGLAGGNQYGPNAAAVLISPTIDLSAAVNPELQVWAGGSSETGFDQLAIRVRDVLTPSSVLLVAVLDGGRTENPLPTYQVITADLSAFVGTTVQVEFAFTSDGLIEDGQGWNVDDVLVVEA